MASAVTLEPRANLDLLESSAPRVLPEHKVGVDAPEPRAAAAPLDLMVATDVTEATDATDLLVPRAKLLPTVLLDDPVLPDHEVTLETVASLDSRA